MAGQYRLPQRISADNVSSATRLLEKRRQMFEVQEALESQIEEFKRKHITFVRREETLRKKDQDLQEALVRFNKPLQENDTKIQRAKKKREDEIRLATQKDQEILKLRQAVESLQMEQTRIKAQLNTELQYERFLESVVQASAGTYSDPLDILKRHETLDATHITLNDGISSISSTIDELRIEEQRSIKETQTAILQNNVSIANLQSQKEEAEKRSVSLQANRDRSLKSDIDQKLELGQIQLGCENIFQRCVSSSRKGPDTKDIFEKLKYIKLYLSDLNSISQEIQQRPKTSNAVALASNQLDAQVNQSTKQQHDQKRLATPLVTTRGATESASTPG